MSAIKHLIDIRDDLALCEASHWRHEAANRLQALAALEDMVLRLDPASPGVARIQRVILDARTLRAA